MKIGLLLLLFLSCFNLAAQKELSNYLEEGQTALDNGNVYLAERVFEKACKEYPQSLEANYQHGLVLLNINEYLSASVKFKTALNLDTANLYPESENLLARCEKSAGLYQDALSSYQNIYNNTLDQPKSIAHRKSAKEIATIRRIIDGDFKGLETRFENEDKINTSESDFAPSFLDVDKIIYSASNGVFEYLNQLEIKQYLSENKSGEWGKGKKVSNLVNKPNEFSANGVLGPDEDFFYFTLCEPSGNCKIHKAPFINGEFGISRPLILFADNNNATHPFPFKTKEGKEGLLYTSTQKTGYGGLDIYVSWLEDGTYTQGKNLGPFINSTEDEITPFYIPERNVLFLSSSWHGGLGEKDIFYCYTPNLELFTQLINLKKPFNSAANDSYFKLNKDLNQGLLVSNREGGKKNRYRTCCNDIYSFDYPFDSIHSDYDVLMAQLMDTIQYVETEKPAPEIDILLDSLRNLLPLPLYFHNDEPNPKTTLRTTQITYEDALNSYLDKKPEYLEVNNTIEIADFFDFTLPHTFKTFNQFLSLLDKLYSLTPYPIVLAVRGYASPLAKSDYNIYLSERRISSLQNYFYQQEFIQKDSLNSVVWTINPYGESASNKNVSDDYSDVKNSIYSLSAMLERRVEVQWLQLDKSRIIKDTIPQETKEVNSLFYPLGRIKKNTLKKAVIALYNPFETDLNIAEVRASCSCTEVNLERYKMAAGKSIPVALDIVGADKLGEQNLEVMFYPADENQKPIRVILNLEVVE